MWSFIIFHLQYYHFFSINIIIILGLKYAIIMDYDVWNVLWCSMEKIGRNNLLFLALWYKERNSCWFAISYLIMKFMIKSFFKYQLTSYNGSGYPRRNTCLTFILKEALNFLNVKKHSLLFSLYDSSHVPVQSFEWEVVTENNFSSIFLLSLYGIKNSAPPVFRFKKAHSEALKL